MKLLSNLIYIVKYSLIGGLAGFAILFFIPDSPMSFNWNEAQNAWEFYQNSQIESDSMLAESSNQPQITSYAKAIEKAGPSVVSVQARRKGRVRPAKDGKKGDMLVDISVGVGSGVIFDSNGYIVTNYHVIAGSYNIAVHFSNGLRKYAKVVGYDQQNDIAVLKVDIQTPLVADLAISSDVKTGDIVMAIGTPFGLFKNSVTLGIVSAINRGTLSSPRIQTDASINYGNSGGALINTKGQVIGISSAKFTIKRNEEIGINFGIPINIVKEIFEEIKKRGRVVRNWIGINGGSLSRQGYNSLKPGVEFGIGFFVASTESGSPASEAGLKYKDLITHYNGELITSGELFRKLFIATPIGEQVEIDVIREGQRINMTLKLREKPI